MPETPIWPVNPVNPEPAVIERAAAILRAGGLVAFPTETVYGLGANALDADAVRRIFEAKGRPATNPVIVHVADLAQARSVIAAWPESAQKLSTCFWPGPLTLVLPRAGSIPEIVTAGGPTVAIRCPAHPVARSLLHAAGVPIAAPSANRSTELSPTTAAHVRQSLEGRIDAILDGGGCPVGIESTVLDLSADQPAILRPGTITQAQIESVIGPLTSARQAAGIAKSPGQMARHYAPATRLVLCHSENEMRDWLAKFPQAGLVGWDRPDPLTYARILYSELHRLDREGRPVIIAWYPPDESQWAGVRDRLKRAATS